MTTALVPLSANPPTWGHIWLVRQALDWCNQVVVFVGLNRNKEGQYLVTPDEAIAFMKAMLSRSECQRVTFLSSSSLLADICIRVQPDIILRGSRSDSEKEEREGFSAYAEPFWTGFIEKLQFLTPPEEYRSLSSTVVRFLVREHFLYADPGRQQYTTDEVWRLTRRRITGQVWVHLVQKALNIPAQPPVATTTINYTDVLREIESENSAASDLFSDPDCSESRHREILYRMVRKHLKRARDKQLILFSGDWPSTVLHRSLFDIHINTELEKANAFTKHGDRIENILWGLELDNWLRIQLRELG